MYTRMVTAYEHHLTLHLQLYAWPAGCKSYDISYDSSLIAYRIYGYGTPRAPALPGPINLVPEMGGRDVETARSILYHVK